MDGDAGQLESGGALAGGRSLTRSLLRLARPHQWAKSAFVLIGPFYGLRELEERGVDLASVGVRAALAVIAFSLASSACYVINDIADREADRLHPRKRTRPIASGAVRVRTAWMFSLALFAGSAAAALALPGATWGWMFAILALYAANVAMYSARLKHVVIVDVMSLSLGFVLRVVAGCVAVGVAPSVWLLNVTLFLAMFLSFGKRLGERRTLAGVEHDEDAALRHRPVQRMYTDILLQMFVVVTAVATLMTYAGYVQSWGEERGHGVGALWVTLLPAMYCLLRAIVLLEHGRYDDPTQLAMHDRAFQAGALVFALLTAAAFWAA